MNPDETPAPGAGEVNNDAGTSQTTPAETTPKAPVDGQGNGGEATPPAVDDPILTLATKKGWDPKQAPGLLAKSYVELESKLGNWRETEKRAQSYEAARHKAEMWDRAQEYLDTTGADGTPDLSKMGVEKLAQLWQMGQIGLADMPADKQYLVQSYLNSSSVAADRAVTQQAESLAQKYPILRDPRVAEVVASRIDAGAEPESAIREVMAIMQEAEKKAELRFKENTRRIKNGNLENSGSPAATKPHMKIRNVRDAFMAAKAEMENAS